MLDHISTIKHNEFVAVPHGYNDSSELPFYPIGIVGGGPAGTGALVAALQNGQLPELLSNGVAIFESGDRLIRGNLGNYQVNSDTLANAFLEVFDRDPDSLLAELNDDVATQKLRTYMGSSVPLPIAGEFLEAMGRQLHRIFERYPRSEVCFNTAIEAAHRLDDGTFLIKGTKAGVPFKARCGQLVLATGGYQSKDDTLNEEVLGERRLQAHHEKVLLTGDILNPHDRSLNRVLDSSSDPRVVIIGSSHSAFSVAWKLLESKFSQRLGAGSIKILYRSRPKVYFNSAADALSAGYYDFDKHDLCPKTQRLYRLAGMRFDGRSLLMNLLGIEGGCEPKAKLHCLNSVEGELDEMLAEADLVVPAFGYRPRAIAMFDESGQPIRLRGCETKGALVDDECRVVELTASGERPMDNVFGVGLASGFIPSGDLGGEPSFRGQTNGFWLYQNDVGQIILRRLLAQMASPSLLPAS